MYEVKYPAALKTHKVKESDLGTSATKTLKEIREIQSGYKELHDSLVDAEGDDKVLIETNILKVEPALEKLDDKLCGLISKNTFYKENALRMKAGKTTKVITPVPKIEPEVEPVIEPPKEEVVLPPVSAKELKVEDTPPPVEVPPVVEPVIEPIIDVSKQTSVVKEEKKKGKGGIGWLIAGVLLTAGIGWGATTNFKFTNPFKRK